LSGEERDVALACACFGGLFASFLFEIPFLTAFRFVLFK
jgi:hypothetical protein